MAQILWGMLFSLFGFVYVGYGRKNELDIPFYSGIFLMIFPYFISNLYLMIAIGVVAVILPFVIRDL